HIADTVSVATTSEVVDRAPLAQNVERENVRPRQIDHMNVIANARPIRRRIVVTEDLYMSAFPGRCLQRDRDDVSLRIMILATLLTRSRGIEISQRCI